MLLFGKIEILISVEKKHFFVNNYVFSIVLSPMKKKTSLPTIISGVLIAGMLIFSSMTPSRVQEESVFEPGEAGAEVSQIMGLDLTGDQRRERNFGKKFAR